MTPPANGDKQFTARCNLHRIQLLIYWRWIGDCILYIFILAVLSVTFQQSPVQLLESLGANDQPICLEAAGNIAPGVSVSLAVSTMPGSFLGMPPVEMFGGWVFVLVRQIRLMTRSS